MSKLLVPALGVVLLVGFGCQKDKNADAEVTTTTQRTDTMRGQDDCPHCPGVQHANAEGKCPECGMKVTAAK